MKTHLYKYCIFIFFLGSINLFAQKFEWVKFFQGNSLQYLNSLVCDKNGNTYFAINFQNEVVLENQTITGGTYRRVYVSRKDSSGRTIWHKIIKSITYDSFIYATGAVLNKKGNQLLFVTADNHIIYDNDTIRRASNVSYGIFMLEINPSGELISGREIITGKIVDFSFVAKNFVYDDKDNFYLCLKFNGGITVRDTITTHLVGNQAGNYILKFSKSGKVFEWYNMLPSLLEVNNIDADKNGNVYVGTFWMNSSNFTFKNQTIYRPQSISGCVFIIDKNGNDKSWFHILSSSGESSVTAVTAYDTNHVYVTGFFKGDSAKFDKTWKKTKGTNYSSYHFISRYHSDGTMVWEKHQDSSVALSLTAKNDYGSISKFENQYIYVSHSVYERKAPIKYDGISYQGEGENFGMNLKIDALGNILWGYRTFFPFIATGTDRLNNMYFGGFFEDDSIRFGPFRAKGFEGDAFVGKTYDYGIFRGPVKSGPYCAGDTFRISYWKTGEFADSNVFYAELSDENGEFLGKHRILGSLQSKDSGTIVGTLPLFKVVSSKNYRIRIRSTAPQAQSFYQVDTLRLLIYSTDKADPGPAEEMCWGDTFKLETFGGTKWTWSPKIRMNDSTSRTPLVWPIQTTQYKIIIADSSGCGESDTAFKTIILKEQPIAKIVTPRDTIVCKGSTNTIIAEFSKGDSLQYNWEWFAIDAQGVLSFLKSGKGKLSDTLQHTLASNTKDSQHYILYLRDNCYPFTKIFRHRILINKDKIEAAFKGVDTMVCLAKPTNITVDFKNGNASGYNWQWFDRNSFGQWIPGVKKSGKTNDTIQYTMPINWNRLKQFRVVLNDNCSTNPDTTNYNIYPRDTLSIKLNTRDTVLCNGVEYTWKATATGGYKPQYKFTWIDNSNQIVLSNSDSLVFKANSLSSIKVQLHDNCMPDSTSTGFSISVNPKLQTEILNHNLKPISDSTLCYGNGIILNAKSNGGKGNNYNYKWILNGNTISIKDSIHFNPIHYISSSGGNAILKLVSSDNCSVPNDTAQIDITMRAALKISGSVKDSICFKDYAEFISAASGGNNNYTYRWIDENNTTISNLDSIQVYNFSGKSTLKRSLILSDGCSVPNDTLNLETHFLDPLKLELLSMDTCVNGPASIQAIVSGGKSNSYSLNWWENNTYESNTLGPLQIQIDKNKTVYKAVLSDNCSPVSDTAYFTIGLIPRIEIVAKGFCFTDTTYISAKILNGLNLNQFKWKINNIVDGVAGNAFKIVLPNIGNYKIQVQNNASYCIGSDSITISIVEKPIPDFDFTHSSRDINGIPFLFFDKSKNATSWLWYFNPQDTSILKNPKHTFPDTGFAYVTLIASNKNICFDTIQKSFPVLDKIEFYFPNVFSPDRNFINDGFGLHPIQQSFVKEYQIKIFNRWGELVYSTDKANELWVPEEGLIGVYIYTATIRDIYNLLHEIKGVVLLKE